MIAAADAREPVVICSGCGADEMGCAVKLGLGGKRCCADCGHDDDRRGDGVDRNPGSNRTARGAGS